MDTYNVEWWSKNGTKTGLEVKAYCSEDVINFIKKIDSDFSALATFPTKFPTKTNTD